MLVKRIRILVLSTKTRFIHMEEGKSAILTFINNRISSTAPTLHFTYLLLEPEFY